MKLFRKIVDEREELEMMRVERISFWILFFGLVLAIFIQLFVLGFNFEYIAGEFIVLIIGTVCSLVGYIRRGSWDYFTKPGIKSYLLYGIAAGFIFGIAAPLARCFRDKDPLWDCLLIFVINFIFIFVLVFITLLIFGTITKMRQKKLQQEYKDDK